MYIHTLMLTHMHTRTHTHSQTLSHTHTHITFTHITFTQDIILRLHTNPMKIFGLRQQPNTYVEVHHNERTAMPILSPEE